MMEGAVRASPAPAPPSHAWSICGRDEQSSAGSSSARPRRGRAPRESHVTPRRCTASRELVSQCGRGRRAVIARESSAPSSTRTARLLPRGRSAAQAPLQSRQPRVPSRTASAPAGCGTPCDERASHQHGIGGPRRGRLALTINRHGRLTQRSHCCDPCSPRLWLRQVLSSHFSLWCCGRASSSREASATRTTIATHPLASARGARVGHLRVHMGLCDGVELLRPRPAVVVVASRMRTLMLAAQGSVVDAGRSARLSWRRT